jgi:hypothetical protein
MKTTIKIITTVFMLFLSKNINAQETVTVQPRPRPNVNPQLTSPALPSLDLYGTIPVKYCGAGLGLIVLSNPFTVAHLDPFRPIQVRFGGEFYWSQFDHKNMGELPLSAPQTGNATVRLNENVFGLNAVTRFSLPWSAKITPYVDLFAGLRGFTSGMSITPDIYQKYNQKSTSENLSSMAQFNYGITGGFMASLGKSVKLNVGLMYSYCAKPGEMVNVKSAQMEAGTMVADNMPTPKSMLMAKVGFTFLLDKSKSNCGNSRSGGRSYRYSGGFFRGGGGGGSHINFNLRPSR